MNMNKRLFLILSIAFFFRISVYPQVSFSSFGGIATFQMNHFKVLNDIIAEALPFNTTSADNFGPGLYFGASVNTMLFPGLMFGLGYQYNTTGSRIGTKDYSGFYCYDQILNGHFLYLEPAVIFEETSKYSFVLSFPSGAVFTRARLEEILSVSDRDEKSSEALSALSFAICPSLKASFPVKDCLSAFVSIGYMIDKGGKVHLNGNSNAVLRAGDRIVKTGWTGLRLSAGLNLNLPVQSK